MCSMTPSGLITVKRGWSAHRSAWGTRGGRFARRTPCVPPPKRVHSPPPQTPPVQLTVEPAQRDAHIPLEHAVPRGHLLLHVSQQRDLHMRIHSTRSQRALKRRHTHKRPPCAHTRAHMCTQPPHAHTHTCTCMYPSPPRLRAVLIQARCTSGVSVEAPMSCVGARGVGGGWGRAGSGGGGGRAVAATLRQHTHLAVEVCKLLGAVRKGDDLGGADKGKVLGVPEQDDVLAAVLAQRHLLDLPVHHGYKGGRWWGVQACTSLRCV